MSKIILITGATGRQGGAVIKSLLASNADITIAAVTRNLSSPSAQALGQQSPKIKLIRGDLDNPTAIFTAAAAATSQRVSAVFSVQTLNAADNQGPATEQAQGTALVDAAIAASVAHFVQASVDRHGAANATAVPHFASKHRIEQHLLARAPAAGMTWTVVQPVAFLENFAPPTGAGFAAMWKVALGFDKPLQLVSVADIGRVAAEALLRPESYAGRVIPLVGEEIALREVERVFKEKTGGDLPYLPDEVAAGILDGDYDMKMMFEFFVEQGYGADIAALKKEFPGLLDYAASLEKENSGSVV
ncbi:putative nucleoside-diphosphate-sugar epimerase family protein [Neofusicoccum parvum UCRNP2]|uniref:Putative nucleoside-diphosphate-sugar epimerase family protein n=1 Tax=Botryosphaeria parva (strain UCR-NP2) TaxID=1287680 RepID=R1EUH9_BOTPV|nr:putative nucleoside-diphosphate-sugar epimerase family protein [Neofusicoccum parvum UCRNP2]